MDSGQLNSVERRLNTIEIFEELYDEFEFLAGSYSELDDAAMSIFELYDNGKYSELIVRPKWEELQGRLAEVERRAQGVAGLITSCRERLAELYGPGNSRESCLRLVELELFKGDSTAAANTNRNLGSSHPPKEQQP